MAQVRTRSDHAVRSELQRLVAHGQPPSDLPLEAFGPWAETIELLREAHPRGHNAVYELFLSLIEVAPALGALLATDPGDECRLITWRELRVTEFPPLSWIVPDVIPTGLTSIGGRPKMGKSWLALQLACAAGTGGRMFDRDVRQVHVLYLGLEDSKRRLKLRAERQRWPEEVDVAFGVKWPDLWGGGLQALRAAIVRGRYGLAIIDTLTCFLGGVDQMELVASNQAVSELHALAMELDVAIVVIDHHRKPSGFDPDPVDDLFGSTGKAQPLDGIYGLYKQRGKKEMLFRMVGREAEGGDFFLVFDRETCCWQLTAEGDALARSGAEEQVLAAVRELAEAGKQVYAATVARHLGLDPSNVGKMVRQLVQAGYLVQGEKNGAAVPLHLAKEP